MTQIKEELIDSNPWWKGEFRLDYKEREAYKQISKFIHLPQMIAFTGLRRVGKTTLMLKIAEDFIKKGFEPRNIIYFSFDEFREVEIRELMKAYEELMERNLREGRFLLLLDEIQKLKNWEDQLKRFYDIFGRNTKVVISGSESLFIKKKSKETLAGRLFEFKIDLLSFGEFLQFKGIDLRPSGLYEGEMRRLFNEFILTLGFPELIGVKEKEVIRKYVRESIVEKIVYRDIPGLFKVKDPAVLESMLNVISEEPGQLIEVAELGKELGVTRQTVSSYLRYLEESFLVRKLYNFSRNRRKVERKLKKYYPTIISPDFLFKEDNHSKSRLLEWLVVNQLKADFFWRDQYKNEVDIILAGKEIIPVEVKYGKVDTQGISAFMRAFKVPMGYVVSLEKEGEFRRDAKRIKVIPAYKFLLANASGKLRT
ncbi:MAG: hypothetical protein Sv326_1311 [Candidatus Fermentimicrarchaeum limneticum]|uniref:AAA+ ATPase domain-containing protein n=1 Tax=Fermentimicrarchaeum limneticum TaxID=2795018 RepID=A0A7D5XMC7_FERL1|nr:MAG: hypothetical protein Sv326_1311 [Candidatus Fermentimicrarchaeum limneticum]